MIKSLSIKNYALIERLEMAFFPGLNIITGETGAGKSILLGSLELAMGKRADTGVLYDNEQNCSVELEYDIHDYGLQNFFSHNDIDYSDTITITRTINPSGKSRAFINDQPVNLNVLRELTLNLILMHRQFDNLEINNSDYQLRMIDNFAGHDDLLTSYRNQYSEYKQKQRQLNLLKEQMATFSREMDIIEYQFSELNAANLNSDEYEESLILFKNLNNAEQIKKTLFSAFNELTEGEIAVTAKLENIFRELNNLELINDDFSKGKEALSGIIESLYDIANKYHSIAENSDYDEEKIHELEMRIDLFNSLKAKYKVVDIASLISLRDELELKRSKSLNISSEIQQISQSLDSLHQQLVAVANQLRQQRIDSAMEFSGRIEQILRELALPHTRLKIELEELDDLNIDGLDRISFWFSANKGSDFKMLKDVISGGELARLALAIEATIAGKMSLPTLIFDEIEAGISGEVARKMGKILKTMSEKHQIISITHSPQIAANADHHYYVYKKTDGEKTFTGITLLDKSEQIFELAKMLSGDPPTEGALKNAGELIEKH
jgi:DNA repair protein RecN (Recombination protein N)